VREVSANAVSKQSVDPTSAARRFKTLALSLLGVYAFLVLILVREGEFWPFSRFPMFSRAGRGWERALVREIKAREAAEPLTEVWEDELPGKRFRLNRFRINQDDLSQVVQRMQGGFAPEHGALLEKYFDDSRRTRYLVLYSVRGNFRPDRSVRIRYRPLAVIGPDGARAVTAEPTPEPQP
jgi:hypothetical protein